MTMTRSSIFTFLNAYCSPFPFFLKPPVGGAGCEVPSIAACSFNFIYISVYTFTFIYFIHIFLFCLNFNYFDIFSFQTNKQINRKLNKKNIPIKNIMITKYCKIKMRNFCSVLDHFRVSYTVFFFEGFKRINKELTK